ncbi:ferredoxin [Streptomyces sp. MUM 203J]|uniref:ferredoxin n=1 Tax=Streptomyces sp. MUM 203J TaxID=2791990 RepID=UPI001F04D048|nr:ferredoxin [Streptomyces sp. MUM 203J]MCH0541756.1 ferredoxin [Streptomyces sp. MUM 203J]
MDIRIDRDRCVGAGMCALTAPAVFEQEQEEGLVLLLDHRPPHDQHTAARLAAGLCPASAVTVREQGPSAIA